MKTITLSNLRKDMKKSFEEVVDNNELLIVHRGNDKDVVILPLEEYNSMVETSYLLRSENNRKRLAEGIKQAEDKKTKKLNLDEL